MSDDNSVNGLGIEYLAGGPSLPSLPTLPTVPSVPNASTTTSSNSSSSTSGVLNKFISWVENGFSTTLSRIGIVILGMILIAVGLYMLSTGKTVTEVVKYAK